MITIIDLGRDLDTEEWYFVLKFERIYRQNVSSKACTCSCGEEMCRHITYLLTTMINSEQYIQQWSAELFNAFDNIWIYLFRDYIFENSIDRTECPICFELIERGDASIRCFSCKNVFHQKCIQLWLSRTTNCPMCRKTLQYPQ